MVKVDGRIRDRACGGMVADKRLRRPFWIDACVWQREANVLSGLCMCDLDGGLIIFAVAIGPPTTPPAKLLL